MSNIDAEARERGAQLTARIAQRAVIGAKLAEALREMVEALARDSNPKSIGVNKRIETARAALAEWDTP